MDPKVALSNYSRVELLFGAQSKGPFLGASSSPEISNEIRDRFAAMRRL